MASVRVAFTIKPDHPRGIVTLADLAAFQARAANTTGPTIGTSTDSWEAWWRVQMRPWLRNSLSPTPLLNVANAFNLKMLACGLADWLGFGAVDSYDYFAAARANALEMASHFHAGDSVVSSAKSTRRDQLLGMVWVYDLCYSKLSSGDRTTIATAILDGLDTLSIPDGSNNASKELMDGHTRIDQCMCIIATLVIQGESGLTSRIQTHQDRGLDFWFGGNSAISQSGYAAMDTDRVYSSDGGAMKGPHYQALSNWGSLQMLHVLKNSTTSLTLQGEAYDPWDEPWTKKAGLWFLALGIRPDGEAFQLGDTLRQNNPVFGQEARLNSSALSVHGDYQKEMWNFYNIWQGTAAGQNQGKNYERAMDFVLAPRDPSQIAAANSTLSSSNGLLSFPFSGAYVYTHGPYGGASLKAKHTAIHMQLTQWYYRGHRDLDCGLIQICHEDDMVLLNSGYYSTSSGETAAVNGGTHNLNWKKQSVSKSGIPLVDDGAANPHQNYNAAGTKIFLNSGEGGQLFKQLSGSLDHENVINMQSDGSGQAWRCTEGRTSTVGAEVLLSDDRKHFIYANTYRAYIKEYTELGTSTQRVLACQHNLFVIREGQESPNAIVFRVVFVKSRTAGMLKQDQWHTWGNPVLQDFPTTGMFSALGYRATEGLSTGSKIVISYMSPSSYNIAQIGDGTVSTFGANQFSQGGTNYPPDFLNSARHLPDIGRYRVKVTPKVTEQNNYFTTLLMPMKSEESPPLHEFVETVDYIAVRFPASGNVYQISKVNAGAIGPDGGVDTTPPAAVTNLQATSPSSQHAQLTWDPVPGDVSMDNGGKYKVYRRLG